MKSGTRARWGQVELADLVIYAIGGDWGKAPDVEDKNYVLVRCIRASEMKNWEGDRGRTAALRKIKSSSLASRELRSGDIILEVSGGGPEQPVGRTVLIDEHCLGIDSATPKVCTNFFRLLRTASAVDSTYLNQYLQHFHAGPDIKKYQGGSNNLRNLRFQDYLSISVPLPPFAEQRRIVAKIEELSSELDKGVESLKIARAQLKTYRQSLLKTAFEGRLTEQWRREAKKADKLTPVNTTLEGVSEIPRPNRWKTRSKDVIYAHPCLAVGNPKAPLPDEWQWVPLVDIARMESGHTPSRRHPEWWDGDIPWIGIADARANNGKVITATTQHTNEEGLENSAARLLPEGTVCVSRTASVGYVVEMGCNMATSQDFVNWIPSEAVTSAWLRLLFGAHKEYLLRFSKGTTHRTIYFPEWLSVHIGLPPLEEQNRIVEAVEANLSQVDALEYTLEQSLGQSGVLRQSVLKRAFEGKLVPQDPNDEPAIALLERIRQEQADAPKPARRKRRTGVTA